MSAVLDMNGFLVTLSRNQSGRLPVPSIRTLIFFRGAMSSISRVNVSSWSRSNLHEATNKQTKSLRTRVGNEYRRIKSQNSEWDFMEILLGLCYRRETIFFLEYWVEICGKQKIFLRWKITSLQPGGRNNQGTFINQEDTFSREWGLLLEDRCWTDLSPFFGSNISSVLPLTPYTVRKMFVSVPAYWVSPVTTETE